MTVSSSLQNAVAKAMAQGSFTQGEILRTIPVEKGRYRLNPAFPHDGECKSGHTPVPARTTRFFSVAGTFLPKERSGIYCEYCLNVTAIVKEHRKHNKPLEFDPEEEVERRVQEAWRSYE